MKYRAILRPVPSLDSSPHRAGMSFVLVAGALLCASLLVAQDSDAPDNPGKTDKLLLVENGVSRAPIVIFADAPPVTRRAADELAEYIEKISGARPKIIEGQPDPLPQRAIWVGYQPKLKELFPKVDFDFQHPEEILITANENHLVIAGRDRWDPDRLNVPGRNSMIVGQQQEYGTHNAVYTFLQRDLEVRWFWPGELGEDIVQRDTIAVAPQEYRYHPRIRRRHTLFRFSALGDGRGRSHEWTRRQRLQLDSLHIEGGHAFTDWWDKYHESNPDYFALQPDGSRSSFPEPHKVKICQSNPRVWQQWLANVEETLEKNPDQRVFSASPNDSYHRGHCVCDGCRAWDHPDGQLLRYVWEGVAEYRPALSDRQVTFANTLGRLLEKKYPGRDLFVGMHAYGHYRSPPIAAVPDANVIISSVANIFYRAPDFRDEHREQFCGWAEKSPTVFLRPNLPQWMSRLAIPHIARQETIDNLRLVAEHGCVGLFFDTNREHWSTQNVDFYLMAQLAWDPLQDGRALLDDFYRRGFGPAADEVRAFHDTMEAAFAQVVKIESGRDLMQHLVKLREEVYTDALFAKAEAQLQRAAERAAGSPGKYARRVAFLRAGLDYTRHLLLAIAAAQCYAESKEQDTAARDEARAHCKAIERIDAEHPHALYLRVISPKSSNIDLPLGEE
jgi:hypothetical protein